MYNQRMMDYYLIILGNQFDPCATWVGPMKNLEEAVTLNEKTGHRGQVTSVDGRFGPLSASRVVAPLDYKKGVNH